MLLTCHRNNYRALSKLTVMLGTDIEIPFDLEMEMEMDKGKGKKGKALLGRKKRYCCDHKIVISIPLKHLWNMSMPSIGIQIPISMTMTHETNPFDFYAINGCFFSRTTR